MTPVDLVAVLGLAAFVVIVSLGMAIYFLAQSQSDN
ncbi:hypothetical protein SAMN05192532_101587 [Alteribacillus iranensis]|uniref:Uncharacterized protein n=1 Tax=Alteribacillus iranensis TaxID=930128 RepID=A0A1I2A107_9BACI|nr:hypothetical protein SAMN05192532_101587 [Alteribacillus iranensis]